METYPTWGGEFTKKIERDRIYHLHELKGGLTFTGADYTLINGITDDCEIVTVTVERFCAGVFNLYFTGQFTKFDCKINHFKCSVSVKPKTVDAYKCTFDGWDEVTNIYSATGSVISVRQFHGTYEAGIQTCSECRVSSVAFPVCTSSTACVEVTEIFPGGVANNCASGQYYAVTYFHRITATGTAILPPPHDSGWTLLSGTTWWRCPAADELGVGVLRSGRRFDAVLAKMVLALDCSLTIRSHFFAINATHAAAPVNDAYDYAALYYENLTVHQKSDVKRPDGDQSFALVWTMKLKDMLADLQKMFNVFWRIEGSDLIIEHISYFQATAGADYSTKIIPLEVDYDIDTPKKERFYFADEECTDTFKGVPITYNCGNEIKEHKCALFSTDVAFIRDELNQDKISDDRYVLISNRIESGAYILNTQNDSLAWENLHDKLHRHYRPFGGGTMNGVAETFISTQPGKKLPDFTVPYCCDSDHNPAEYVTTSFGQGHVQSQTENIKKNTLTLQLNYE